jgi:hypothetical protein
MLAAMPNLQTELEQLELANEHVATAERGIRRLQALLEEERRAGFPTEEAARAVQVAREGLVEFERHRDLIVQTIQDIKSGRLPSTSSGSTPT